jgi:undecaprenyl diphosphate synthase
MNQNKLPKHVAIIMDGNGRWAQRRNLPRVLGHEAGVKTVQEITKICAEKQLEVLTLFAFGIENWGRPREEVDFLMTLFFKTLSEETEALNKNNVQLHIIGDHSLLSAPIQAQILESQRCTANNTGLKLVVAINYSGRWDIVQGMKKIAKEVALKQLEPDAITDSLLQEKLCLSHFPEPDLFIRTSGEQRISNFFLWQLAYTELYFTEVLWPDFDANVFEQALLFYASRQRRFGLTGEQIAEPNPQLIPKRKAHA